MAGDADRGGGDLMKNFLLMSFCFAVNISCVISCLSYATAILGEMLGGYGGGVLYVFSAATALFGSNPLVSMMGPRRSLLFGLGFYCFYVVGFLLAVIVHKKFPLLGWVSFLTGSVFGGIASGVVWTAQGRYFGLNSKLYAEKVTSSTEEEEEIVNLFAGIFAFIFLGTECFLRAFASVLFLAVPSAATHDVVFTVYGGLAVMSLLMMIRVDDMGEEGTWKFVAKDMFVESSAAVLLVGRDLRLLLLIPFQLCVGLAFSFVPFYVFGTIIADSDNLGSAYVGLISACIPLTGSAMAFPTAALGSRCGKPLPMTIGAIGLGSAGLAVILFSDEVLGTWPYVMSYIIIYGIGRGVYENTNKAVVVEFFGRHSGRSDGSVSEAVRTSNDITAAFATINFSRNIASAFGYFTFQHMRRVDMALLVSLFAVAGLVSYLFAHTRHKSQLNVWCAEETSSSSNSLLRTSTD